MMIETAKVLAYRDGVALVQCRAQSSCGGCIAEKGCGTKALSALAGEKFAPTFEVAVPRAMQAGEQIQIGLSEQALLKSVGLLYGLPLLVLIAGAFLFSRWIENELGVAAALLCTVGLTFLAVKRQTQQNLRAEYKPVYLGDKPSAS